MFVSPHRQGELQALVGGSGEDNAHCIAAASTGGIALLRTAGRPALDKKHLYKIAQEPDECCDMFVGFPVERKYEGQSDSDS